MKTEVVEVPCSIPIRRSRWPSFWIGVVSGIGALLTAGVFAGSLLLLPLNINGVVIILTFGTLWFSLFFFSLPRQRRYARTLDSRQSGVLLTGSLLIIPVTTDLTLPFNLDEPYQLMFGWYEAVTQSAGGPTTRTRSFMTYAILSQAERQLLLKAEESVREAQAAGWPNATSSATPAHSVRLWANDLVVLIEAMRARSSGPVETI